MFIRNADGSFIGYKDLVNNVVLLFDCDGNAVKSNTNIRCSNWSIINLFEVPIAILEQVTSIVG
jgi:hypothetical protein